MKAIRCSCGRTYLLDELTRAPTGQPAWRCLWCNLTICVRCYVLHTQLTHPEKQ